MNCSDKQDVELVATYQLDFLIPYSGSGWCVRTLDLSFGAIFSWDFVAHVSKFQLWFLTKYEKSSQGGMRYQVIVFQFRLGLNNLVQLKATFCLDGFSFRVTEHAKGGEILIFPNLVF